MLLPHKQTRRNVQHESKKMETSLVFFFFFYISRHESIFLELFKTRIPGTWCFFSLRESFIFFVKEGNLISRQFLPPSTFWPFVLPLFKACFKVDFVFFSTSYCTYKNVLFLCSPKEASRLMIKRTCGRDDWHRVAATMTTHATDDRLP